MIARTIWSQMSGKTVDALLSPDEIVLIDGQSLGLGHNGTATERAQEGYRNRPAARMPKGLMRSDVALAMPLHGPLSVTYADAQATGLDFAIPSGNIPASLTFATALDRWRKKLSLDRRRLIVGFNGIGGQPVIEFDRDPATPGTWGTKIRDNWSRWITEVRRVSPRAVPLVYSLLQGEANAGDSEAYYLERARISIDSALDDIQTLTGVRPPLLVWQTGGYVDTTGRPYGPTLAQLKLVEMYDAVFAGPLYPNFFADNTVHPTLNYQVLHSEIAAMVWAHREARQDINLLPGVPIWNGNSVRVPFRLQPGRSLIFDPVDKYASYGGISNHGVEVTGANIIGVTLDGDTVVVNCDAPPSRVQFAMQSANVSAFADANQGNYGAHRCDIMESSPASSLMLPGWELKRFIPSCRFDRPS